MSRSSKTVRAGEATAEAEQLVECYADAAADPVEFWATMMTKGWTTNQVGDAVGYDASVISRIMKGNYEGNVEAVRESCRIAQERLLGGKREVLIETAASLIMEDVLEDSYRSESISVVTGNSGVGKTSGLNRYLRKNPSRCLVVTCMPQEGGYSLLGRVMAALGTRRSGGESYADLIATIGQTLRRSRQLLMIDEGNNLVQTPKVGAATLNTLRAINDVSGYGQVIVGTQELTRTLFNPRYEGMFEMVASRVGIEARLPDPTLREIRALLVSHFREVSDSVWETFLRLSPKDAGGDPIRSMRRTSKFCGAVWHLRELNGDDTLPLDKEMVRLAWGRLSGLASQ